MESSMVNQLVTAAQGAGMDQVLEGIVALLPVVLPIAVGFIAVRKGIGFILGILHQA